MATLLTLRTSVRAYLGTSENDRAFASPRLTQWINDAYHELVADLPGSYLLTRATLTADSATGRVYSLATQATPITTWRQFRDVRLAVADGATGQGAQLEEVDRADLESWRGACYSVYGSDAAVQVETSPDVQAGADLDVLYTYWPTDLSDDADSPSVIPAQFHDLIALEAARLAFPSGGEGRWPADYETRRIDRRAQFVHHCGQRGGTPSVQRVRDPNW